MDYKLSLAKNYIILKTKILTIVKQGSSIILTTVNGYDIFITFDVFFHHTKVNIY